MLNNSNETPIAISRHASRFIAILSLYSYQMDEESNKSLSKIASNTKKLYLNKDVFGLESKAGLEVHHPDEQLLEQLISLSQSKNEEIQQLIKDHLIAKYNLDKLDKVISAILRLAALELLYCGDVPAKIIIDEYVSLTKTFYENNEAGFVNKVIDTMARSTRATEIE